MGTLTYPTVANGCKYHDDCLTCPYPDCIYGENGSVRSFKKKQRDIEVRGLWRDGMSRKDIAIQFSVCGRTVERALEKEYK